MDFAQYKSRVRLLLTEIDDADECDTELEAGNLEEIARITARRLASIAPRSIARSREEAIALIRLAQGQYQRKPVHADLHAALDAAIDALDESRIPAPPPKKNCTCSDELRRKAPGIHSSDCPVIGGHADG